MVPLTDTSVRRALTPTLDDFEDAVTQAVAEEAGISVIVTRNVRDFSGGPIPGILPEAFRPE